MTITILEFFQLGPTILHKQFPVISSKIEGVTVIFAILDFCEFFIKVWTCDTFLESLEPLEYNKTFSIFYNQSGLGEGLDCIYTVC